MPPYRACTAKPWCCRGNAGCVGRCLLLRTLEALDLDHAAAVVGVTRHIGRTLLNDAMAELRRCAAADTLIIEDEHVVAMRLEAWMTDCGHRVIGAASSEEGAAALVERVKPGLILADVNLSMGGNGPSAVARILRQAPTAVIFVTAYPQNLLTGQRPEAAFVLEKPFDPAVLPALRFQAVSGGAERA